MSKRLFVDLGFASDEARELSIRADIAERIALLIQERKLKQREAASLFKVPQPTISKIVSGNISNLSLTFLIRMLLRADLPFKICRSKLADEVEVTVDGDEEQRVTNYTLVKLSDPCSQGSFRITADVQSSAEASIEEHLPNA